MFYTGRNSLQVEDLRPTAEEEGEKVGERPFRRIDCPFATVLAPEGYSTTRRQPGGVEASNALAVSPCGSLTRTFSNTKVKLVFPPGK